jgi:hypothetical protein
MAGLPDPEHSPATAAAREALAQLTGRSPLLGWMRQHHALITERMNTVRPSWQDVARILAELGVRDVHGAPPKVEAVRRAYHRVAGALDAKGLRRRRSKAQMAAAKAAAAPLPASVAATSEPSPAPMAHPLPAPALPLPVMPFAARSAPAAAPSPPARPVFDPTEGAFDPKPPPRFKPASLK